MFDEKAFPDIFADPRSQEALVSAYWSTMNKMIGSTINVAWKKKNGVKVDTTVIMVPIAYKEHLFALHFISKK